MQRRQARERRDYLYRRALTLRDAELAAKRAALKQSLSSGRPLTKDLAEDTVSSALTSLLTPVLMALDTTERLQV
jgi:hypothetical protein